jgi:hypothetical protein
MMKGRIFLPFLFHDWHFIDLVEIFLKGAILNKFPVVVT